MIKNIFKNMNIYKKILTAFLSVLSVVGIFMLVTCFLIIFKIKNYSLKEISGLSSEVFEIGGSSLKEQAKSSLKDISYSLSKNVQNSLNNISDKVLISCESIEKIIQNKVERRSLESLRDTLLPKLMSGEIRVSELC